jgi:signal transduction histidine kinase
LLRHVELSVESGIGAHLYVHGRIMRRWSEEARADIEAQKEFELLGTQVAIPILDREGLVGVALFDGRITGEALPNLELQLIFHLLEQVGLALKNIWLHDQLAANHEILAEVLRELSHACVVVSRDLKVLHANKACRRLFLPADRRSGDFDFTDLPQALGAKVYQVLKTGAAVSSFRYEPEQTPGTICSASIVPFHREAGGLPASALLMVEDLTQSEQLKRLEIETSNLRLVRSIAERLTNEIGNALVPLTVHQQMLNERLGAKKVDAEFLRLMERDLHDSVRRVTRLTSQMRFLARDAVVSEDAFPLPVLLEEAYQEARSHMPDRIPEWSFQPAVKEMTVKGDRSALKHAFVEVLLNGLQANPSDPKITVEVRSQSPGNGRAGLIVEVRDNGGGFTPESLQKATAPFFTTRVVGIGLGLTVAQKIVEAHGGRLDLPSAGGQPGLVRITLPESRIQVS